MGAAYTHSSYSAWCTTGDYVVLNDLATYAWTLEARSLSLSPFATSFSPSTSRSQVYGDFGTSDVFAMFNPVLRTQYDHVIDEWVGVGLGGSHGIIDTLLDDAR